MNLSRLLGSKRTNEYSRTDKARFQDLCKIHLNTEFDDKSEDIFFVVCQVTSCNLGQIKQREFAVLLSILINITEL